MTYANRQSALNAIKNMHHSQTMEVRTKRGKGGNLGFTKGATLYRSHKGVKVATLY